MNKADGMIQRVKQYSRQLGQEHGRQVSAFVAIRVTVKTGAITIAHGMTYCSQSVFAGTRFTGGGWKNDT